MRANRRTAVKEGKEYQYTIPSPTHYPFQWFWDSCFHAVILTRLGELEAAGKELESLLTWQSKSGFIPHVIFWDRSKVNRSPSFWHWRQSTAALSFLPFSPKPKITAEIQPPVIAFAVERVFEQTQDRAWLKRLLPKLTSYYDWLQRVRDPDRDHLISIITGFESGIDQSPAYDQALGIKPDRQGDAAFVFKRSHHIPLINKLLCYHPLLIKNFAPFFVEDVLVNSIYAQGLASLARLAAICKETSTAERLTAKASRVTEALIAKCWDEDVGLFWNLDGPRERHAKVKTILSLMPLILPNLPKAHVTRLAEHLTNPEEFALPHPIPSVAGNEPSFTPDISVEFHNERPLWRGTTWVNINWFLVHGLRQHGYGKLAQKIATKTVDLVTRHGFREYFNPITGEPGTLSARNFSWSALAIDL